MRFIGEFTEMRIHHFGRWCSDCRKQALTLKFQLLLIHFTSEAYESSRKMSVIRINANYRFDGASVSATSRFATVTTSSCRSNIPRWPKRACPRSVAEYRSFPVNVATML